MPLHQKICTLYTRRMQHATWSNGKQQYLLFIERESVGKKEEDLLVFGVLKKKIKKITILKPMESTCMCPS